MPTASGEWWARMGQGPGRPGLLERVNGDTATPICCLPEVTHRVTARNPTNGARVAQRVALRWHNGDTQCLPISVLSRVDTWEAAPFPIPPDTKILVNVAAAIGVAAQYAPEIDATPRLDDNWRLQLPPADFGPAGLAGGGNGDDRAGRHTWRAATKIIRANPKLALFAGAAMAGPWLAALGRDPFVLHAVGESSEGKSTALRLAAAVLGDPRHLVGTWNTTSVGLTRRLGHLAILPAIVDELGAGGHTPASLEALMYRLADGTDRTTATRTGDTTLTGARWHSVLISSGNRGLANLNNSAGLPARVIDLPSPITATADAADQLQALLPALAGWPLRWALDEHQQLEPLAELLARADQQLAEWRGGRLGRLARHLAACIAGARQLERLIITAPGLGDAAQAAALDHLADTDALLEEQGSMPDRLLSVIFEAAAARPYAYPNQFEPPGIREVEGYDNNDGRLLVLTGALTKIAAAAGIADPLPALRELRHRGTLESDVGQLATRDRMSGRIVRVYAFRVEDDLPRGPARGPARGPVEPEPSEKPWSDEAARPRGPRGPVSHIHPYACAREDALGRRLAALDSAAAARITDLDDLDAMEAALDALDVLPPPPPPPPAPRPPSSPTGPSRTPVDLDTRRGYFAAALERLEIPATEAEAAAGLAALEAAVRLTYEAPTPARAGLQWLHAVTRYRPAGPVDLPLNDRGQPDIRSSFSFADPDQANRHGELVQVDVNASFANAAQALYLGDGDQTLVHHPEAGDLKRPGYVSVANPSPAWPSPWRRLKAGERLWTPLAALLAEHVPDAELVNAILWERKGRRLYSFARRLLNARARLGANPDDPAGAMASVILKRVYSTMLGGMLNAPEHNPTPYLRPDWAWTIKAGAAAAMWRHLARLGDPGPVAVYAPDAALFIVEPGATPALTLSNQPGKWKLERRVALDDTMRQAIRRGKPLTLIQAARRAEKEISP